MQDYTVTPITTHVAWNLNAVEAWVTAPEECPWNAVAVGSHVLVTNAGQLQYGSGGIQITFPVNNDPTARVNTVMVAGQAVLVTQGGKNGEMCSPQPNTHRLDLPSSGGVGTVTFTLPHVACAWMLAVRGPWISVSGPTSGSGTGATLTVSVDPNPHPSMRTAYLALNDVEISVDQAAAPGGTLCTFTVTPSSLVVPQSESDPTRRIDVITQSGCEWSASAVASFLHVYEVVYYGGEPHGTGHVRVLVENNPQNFARTGTVTVAGKTVAIEQLGYNPEGGLPSEPTDLEVRYYHSDVIGSVRLITKEDGSAEARYDYTPFGVELGINDDDAPRNRVRFGGKESDVETRPSGQQPLNYFGARYYQGQTGRFTTTDPVFTWQENIIDPQRWNRYIYARNSPLRFVDPDGRSIKAATLLFKVAQAVYKGHDVYSTVEGAVEAGTTLVSPDSTPSDRAWAAAALASEVSGLSDAFKAGKSILRFNSWGQAGKPDHQATVERLRGMAEKEFPDAQIRVGTSIRKETGVNRRPDVTARDPTTRKILKVYEAARTVSDRFVPRERKKQEEYDAAGIESHFEPVDP